MPASTPSRTRASLPLVLFVLAVVAAGLWERSRPPSAGGSAQVTNSAAPLTTSSTEARPMRAEPAHDLSVDEARGGHTLARHVGRTDEDLRDRLRHERDISAASTYTDRATAEATVAQALEQHADRVASWLAREDTRPNLALDYRGSPSRPIGRSLMRNRQETVPCYDALVVLRSAGRADFYVLTTYPEARR